MAESWLCQEVDRIITRLTRVESALDRLGVFDSQGRLRGATWEVSDQRIASWRADTPLPLGDTGYYTQIRQGKLSIKGGAFDISTGPSGARMQLDSNAMVGYNPSGELTFKADWTAGTFWTKSGGFGGSLGSPLISLNADGTASIAGWSINADNLSKNNIILSSAGYLRSNDFTSGVSGWSITPTVAEFGNIVARGELQSTVFVKNLVEAHAGTMIVSKSGGALSRDMVVPASGTWTMYLKNPPGGGLLLSSGDIIRIKAQVSTGVADTWYTVGAGTVSGSEQYYTCTYSYGTRPVTYAMGCAVVDYGGSGTGVLTMTADLTDAPYYQVATHAGSPWSTQTVLGMFGNLAGSYGYASGTPIYGVGLGLATGPNLVYEGTNGLRIRNSTTEFMKVSDGAAVINGTMTVTGLLRSATSGKRTEFSSAGIKGYGSDGTTVQWDATNADGSFTAGAGSIKLDNSGITISAYIDSRLRWMFGSEVIMGLTVNNVLGDTQCSYTANGISSNKTSKLALAATSGPTDASPMGLSLRRYATGNDLFSIWKGTSTLLDIESDGTTILYSSAGSVYLKCVGSGQLNIAGTLVINTDTNLYRSSADVLATDDAFRLGGTLYFGSASDTNLYRSAANILATDDIFSVGSHLYAHNHIYMDNAKILAAKNSSGTYEDVMWPRWSDNIMYVNYGSAGMKLRNSSSSVALTMANDLSALFASTVKATGFNANCSYASGTGDVNAQRYLRTDGDRVYFGSTDNPICYLYRSGNDIYWHNGTSGVKLN